MKNSELPKIYSPRETEDKIYQIWEKSGFFNPDNLNLPEDAKTYTIVLPPPNITAKLHLGHSAMLAIEDLLIRFHRMRGYRALWVPGTDHAAIATQNVVEKKIYNETGLTRHDLGKEKFLEKVWDFLKETQSTILYQTRKMGSSLDWSREAFTLDEDRKKAVTRMFVDMYKAGIIYRGERIVNWCPRCQSTLADDEVEHFEQTGKLYTFRYWKDFPISISTTRPETKLGDTAVAVNPRDERYRELIGQEFEGLFCGVKLKIKIIADHEVDMQFGTGALGVTPAHSMVDWKMAEKNNLAIVKVIDEEGRINSQFKKYSGMSASEARELIVSDLRENNLLEKEEEIKNNLSVCYRCDSAIEPLPSKQWFVAVDKPVEKLQNKSLKQKSIELATEKQIKFIPFRFTKRYLDWMENLHDWCISRQIWFGHDIPAYYCECGEIIISETKPEACPKCHSAKITQDEDSLDTWFSSGMWTFSTLGWPDNFKNNRKSGDLKKFHPTQVLETGHEILTLWVSRMIMMSLFALGETPFEKVYLHGMVVDKFGKKMSKSKGNGIDPLDVIDKFGTDSVRLSLLIGATAGNDLRLSEEKIEGFRNFINKLWNISRFILTQTETDLELPETLKEENITPADKWIMQKFRQLTSEVNADLKNYKFSPAGEKLIEFTRNDFADWYLEIAKFEENKTEKILILRKILEDLLKLWHPFIPFVTEEIWSYLGKENLLLIEKWPKEENQTVSSPKEKTESFEEVKSIIVAIRNLRAENKIEPTKKIEALIYAGTKTEALKKSEILIKNLRTGIEKLSVTEKGTKPTDALYAVVEGIEIYLISPIDKKKEKERLEKETENLRSYLKNLEARLSDKNFLNKAPANIVAMEKEKLTKGKKSLSEMEKHLEKLK